MRTLRFPGPFSKSEFRMRCKFFMTKRSCFGPIAFLAAVAVLGVSIALVAKSISPEVQEISLPGSPFAVAVAPHGRYVFASLSGATNGIAVIEQGRRFASFVGVLPTGGPTFGLAVTSDGRYLLDTVQPLGLPATQGVQFIDLHRAVAGEANAILGTVPTAPGSAPIEVVLSNDNHFVFVSNEGNATVTVIDFNLALASGENASSIVGNIPVELAPVGLAVSPDDRRLYVTNELANPTDPGYNPAACTGAAGTTPKGTLTVVDLLRAESDPATSVLSSVYAGCSPVRVALSEDGGVAWVTARAENHLLAFSTRKLLRDPSDALLSRTPVGTAPVGIQLFDHDHFIAVANSNRFTPGQIGTVSILDYAKALRGAGASATVGTFSAGLFPRQWALSDDDRFLYLTEFSSNVLAIFPVRPLIRQVEPSHPWPASREE